MSAPVPTLVPSLPASSFSELVALTAALDGVASGFQIDIVDGQFVPHCSWPFTEVDVATEWVKLMTLPSSYQYELDCMVEAPEQYLEVFAELPISSLIIHIGSTKAYDEIIDFAKAQGWRIGLALTNDVSLNELTPFIPQLDLVQVMGIAKVGTQGQPFDQRTIETITTLRTDYPELSIAVDGAVNAETIPQLLQAGANHFAPGSAISKATDPVMAYKQLEELLK